MASLTPKQLQRIKAAALDGDKVAVDIIVEGVQKGNVQAVALFNLVFPEQKFEKGLPTPEERAQPTFEQATRGTDPFLKGQTALGKFKQTTELVGQLAERAGRFVQESAEAVNPRLEGTVTSEVARGVPTLATGLATFPAALPGLITGELEENPDLKGLTRAVGQVFGVTPAVDQLGRVIANPELALQEPVETAASLIPFVAPFVRRPGAPVQRGRVGAARAAAAADNQSRLIAKAVPKPSETPIPEPIPFVRTSEVLPAKAVRNFVEPSFTKPGKLTLMQQSLESPDFVSRARNSTPEVRAAFEAIITTENRMRIRSTRLKNFVATQLDQIPEVLQTTRLTKVVDPRTGKATLKPVRTPQNDIIADILDTMTLEELIADKTILPAIKEPLIPLKRFLFGQNRRQISVMRKWGFEVADDFGLGTAYYPHSLPGSFLIRDKAGNVVSSASNKFMAKLKVNRLGREYPKETFTFDTKASAIGFNRIMIRTDRRNFHAMVKNLAEQLEILPDEMRNAMRGVISTTEGKTKPFGNLQRRKGATGFSKDVRSVLNTWIDNFVRWEELTNLNRKVQPLLAKIRKQNNTGFADFIESNFDAVWGVSDAISEGLDGTLASIPGVRDLVAPQFLERTLARTRRATGALILGTIRQQILNSTQLVTTGVKYSVAELTKAGADFQTKAGLRILRRHGVLEGVASLSEPGANVPGGTSLRLKAARFTPFAAETRNQSVIFLTAYNRARRAGFNDRLAGRAAFLEGQVQSQFASLVSDQPGLARSPLGKSVFQFRRFMGKNIELGATLIKSRNFGGFAKWLGAMAFIGGLRPILRVATAPAAIASAIGISALLRKSKSKPVAATGEMIEAVKRDGYLSVKIWNGIREVYGEHAANTVTFGFPALVAVNLGYSVQLIDLPQSDEPTGALGEQLIPPGLKLFGAFGVALADDRALDEMTDFDQAMRAAERIPALRPLVALQKWIEGDYDFRDTADRLRYRGTGFDVMNQFAGFSTLSSAQQEMFIDATQEITEFRNATANNIIQAAFKSDRLAKDGDQEGAQVAEDEAIDILNRWNTVFGEWAVLTRADLRRRAIARLRQRDQPSIERVLGAAGRRFLGAPGVDEVIQNVNPDVNLVQKFPALRNVAFPQPPPPSPTSSSPLPTQLLTGEQQRTLDSLGRR